MNNHLNIASRLAALLLLLTAAQAMAAPNDGVVTLELKIDSVHEIRLESHHGMCQYIVDFDDNTQVKLTPIAFSNFLIDHVHQPTWIEKLCNISSLWGMLWVGLGLLGQLLFTGRMVVQWLTSERRKRSVIPVSFWWMSLVGGAMLLTYFIWRHDVVGVLGQSIGVVVYSRNLILIHQRARIMRGVMSSKPNERHAFSPTSQKAKSIV